MRRLEDGELVGSSYRVGRALAEGAVGVVYKAWDEALERPVALKVLHSWVTDDRGGHLRREAAAMASIRNDHVVGVYAFGQHDPDGDGGAPYFAMEFVEGRSLASLIHEFYVDHGAAIPLYRALQLLRDLCDGLAAVHGAGIVHRDVKPQNVVIEHRTGRVVLVDFGAAVLARDGFDGRVMGTPFYLAPETANGDAPTPATDIYSVGCTAYEVLSGRGPFRGSDIPKILLQHQRGTVPPISSLRTGLETLDELLARTLAKDPRERVRSATALSNLFEEHLRPAAGDETAVRAEDPSEEGVRILVVDDDPVFGRIAARCARLAMAGNQAQVSRTDTGERALANAARRRPDIIVLDYLLPDMDGVEVLSRIRAGPDGAHPEVIVASGALGVAEQWRFGILGVSDFVAKPVELDDLLRLIHEVAERRGWTKEEGSDA